MIKKTQLTILLEALEIGLNVTDSCLVAGISRETFYKRLKEDAAFDKRVAVAGVVSKQRAIKLIHAAAEKHWQAAAWWLERRYGEEYSLKNNLRVSTGQETIEQWKKEMGIDQENLADQTS